MLLAVGHAQYKCRCAKGDDASSLLVGKSIKYSQLVVLIGVLKGLCIMSWGGTLACWWSCSFCSSLRAHSEQRSRRQGQLGTSVRLTTDPHCTL